MPEQAPRGGRFRQFLMGLVPRPGNWTDWRQGLDMATSAVGIPGDWYNSQTREWNNPLEAFGLGQLFGGGHAPTSPLPTYLDPATAGQAPAGDWRQLPTMPGQDPQGRGPLMAYQAPRPRNIRPGGGQVIAEGEAAQNMVAGMQNRDLGRSAREAIDAMYRGAEK